MNTKEGHRSLLRAFAQAMSVRNRSEQFDHHLGNLCEAILDVLGIPAEGVDRAPLRRMLYGTNEDDTPVNFATLIGLAASSAAAQRKRKVNLGPMKAVCVECGLPSRTDAKKCFWCGGRMSFAKRTLAAYAKETTQKGVGK